MGGVKWSRVNGTVGGVLGLHAYIYTTVVSCVVRAPRLWMQPFNCLSAMPTRVLDDALCRCQSSMGLKSRSRGFAGLQALWWLWGHAATSSRFRCIGRMAGARTAKYPYIRLIIETLAPLSAS